MGGFGRGPRWGALLAVALPVLLIQGAAGSDNQRDSLERVRGAATNRFVEFGGENRLRIRARGLGPDARGRVVGSGNLGNGPFRVRGKVTCIRVEGNRATIKYRYTKRSGPGAPPPGGVQVYVTDRGRPRNGEPVDANGTDPPMPRPLFGETANQCDDPRLKDDLNRVDSGDYRVRDNA